MRKVFSCFLLVIAIVSTNLAQSARDTDSVVKTPQAPSGVERCIPIYDPGDMYYESFDGLANSGTSSALPLGFFISETGSNANATYSAGNGSGTAGDTYSFGPAGETDRALGTLLSGSLVSTIGGCFVNRSSRAVTWVGIAYVGEQWRIGTLDRQDRLDFQYSTDASSLSTGIWADYNNLDFIAPFTTGTVGARDGNTGGVAFEQVITGLNVPINGEFWFRWVDFNASGADDGLAIDDFNIKVPVATTASAELAGRVTNKGGIGIANAKISVVGSGLETPLTAITNAFGYYTVSGLTAGQPYVVSISSRSYFFSEPVRAVTLNESLSDFNWVSSN